MAADLDAPGVVIQSPSGLTLVAFWLPALPLLSTVIMMQPLCQWSWCYKATLSGQY